MGQEVLCFRLVHPSVRACEHARVKAFTDRIVVDFWLFMPSSVMLNWSLQLSYTNSVINIIGHDLLYNKHATRVN